MRLAIVDDDVEFSKDVETQIRNFFKEKQEQVNIWRSGCTDCRVVLQELRKRGKFSVYLFDVEMPGKEAGGLELSRKVHELDPQGKVIFLTSFSKYAILGYQVGAYYYILKNSSWQAELLKILSSILKEEEENKAEFVILSAGDVKQGVLANDILYLTKDRKYTVYHCLDRSGMDAKGQCQEYRERISLEKVYTNLPQGRFVAITKGIIVNMKHVIRTEKLNVIMRDGMRFSISTTRKKQVCDRMAAYWGERM